MSFNIPYTALTQIPQSMNLESVKSNLGKLQNSLSKMRPPQEFFDVRRISKPANFGEIQSRASYNLGYFSANYAAIIALLSVYALVTNTLLLFVIILVAGGLFGITKLNGEDLVIPFGRFNTSQLYTGLLIVAVPLCIFASPISTLMWLIGSSGVTVFSHAALMEKPIETVFEEEV